MRKIVCCFLAVSLMVVITACGNTKEDMSSENTKTIGQTESSMATEAEGNTSMGKETEVDTIDGESGMMQESEDDMAEAGVFNFETKKVLLNSGYEMPVYGIGTYSLTGETCVESVSSALESGVRLIDTAYMYHNEESVGEAVRNSGIPREEILIRVPKLTKFLLI